MRWDRGGFDCSSGEIWREVKQSRFLKMETEESKENWKMTGVFLILIEALWKSNLEQFWKLLWDFTRFSRQELQVNPENNGTCGIGESVGDTTQSG
jgi:hypothetical protein